MTVVKGHTGRLGKHKTSQLNSCTLFETCVHKELHLHITFNTRYSQHDPPCNEKKRGARRSSAEHYFIFRIHNIVQNYFTCNLNCDKVYLQSTLFIVTLLNRPTHLLLKLRQPCEYTILILLYKEIVNSYLITNIYYKKNNIVIPGPFNQQ